MTPRARLLAPFVTTLAAGLLVACGGADEDSTSSTTTPGATSSSSTDSSAKGSTSAHESSADESSAPQGPAHRELTQQQIVEALPRPDEAPEDFVEDQRINSERGSSRETDPDRCRTIYLDSDEARAWKDEHRTESGGVRYTAPGDAAGRASVSTFITTYDEPVPKAFFDDAAKELPSCSRFRERNDAESTWIDKQAGTTSAPVVGQQTYAHRVGLVELDLTIDQIWVRSGHSIISVVALGSYADSSDETLSDVAGGVLEDLEG